jgi:hypothetical protein
MILDRVRTTVAAEIGSFPAAENHGAFQVDEERFDREPVVQGSLMVSKFGFQFGWSDAAVFCPQKVHTFEDGDVNKTGIRMLERLDKSNQDGDDDLAAKSVIGLGDKAATVDLGDDRSRSRVGMHGMSRWVKRYLESFA